MTIHNWIVALLLTLAFGWIAANTDAGTPHTANIEVDAEDAAAHASRDWAAQQVCKGQAFEWIDDKTLVCLREVHAAKGAL